MKQLGNLDSIWLISAAPDLYLALEMLVLLHKEHYGLDGAWDTELIDAEKALQKARGGE